MRPGVRAGLQRRLLVVTGMEGLHGFQYVDGSPAGSLPVTAEIASPLVATSSLAAMTRARPLVLATGEGTVTRFRPTPPPLESRPFPATPVYPLLPQRITLEPVEREDVS